MATLDTRGIRVACKRWLEKKGNLAPTFRERINSSARESVRRRANAKRRTHIERIARELEGPNE